MYSVTQEYCSLESPPQIHKQTCLLCDSKNLRNPGSRMGRLWYIHAVEYYTAVAAGEPQEHNVGQIKQAKRIYVYILLN